MLTIVIILFLLAISIKLSLSVLNEYLEKIKKYVRLKFSILYFLTSGLVVPLVSFLPALFLFLKNNTEIGLFMILYDMGLSASIPLGIYILLFSLSQENIDRDFLFAYLLGITFLFFLILKGNLNFIDGLILYLIYIFVVAYFLYKSYKKERNYYENIELEMKDLPKYLFYSIIIGVSLSLLIQSANIVSDLAGILIEKYNFLPYFIAFIFGLILYLFIDISSTLFLYLFRKEKEVITLPMISSIFTEMTLYLGILLMINPVKITYSVLSKIFPLLLSLYVSALVLYFASYYRTIPRQIGIIILAIAFVIGYASIT